MLAIAICDDDKAARESVVSFTEDLLASRGGEPASISSYANPVDMLADIEAKGAFDLILCDVYMPGLLGTQAIQELRDSGDETHVIFLTSSQDHAVDAFALHADNYLVKPFSREAFEEAVSEVLDKIESERAANIAVKSHGAITRVNHADILYVQTVSNYQCIHLRDGEVLEVRTTSKEFFSRISGDGRFYQLGSSCIVNMDEVRTVSGGQAMMTNGDAIKVPTRLATKFADDFFEYVMSTGAGF